MTACSLDYGTCNHTHCTHRCYVRWNAQMNVFGPRLLLFYAAVLVIHFVVRPPARISITAPCGERVLFWGTPWFNARRIKAICKFQQVFKICHRQVEVTCLSQTQLIAVAESQCKAPFYNCSFLKPVSVANDSFRRRWCMHTSMFMLWFRCAEGNLFPWKEVKWEIRSILIFCGAG